MIYEMVNYLSNIVIFNHIEV